MAVRLDYEMRRYLVTDRSLRIRSGLWKVQEMTMSFANLQQVMVSQGPLQCCLALLTSGPPAGGGGSGEAQHGQTDTMHTGVFHGVEQVVEIRDLILKRLRHFRDTGLGDPDELAAPGAADRHPATSAPADSALLGAARELLQETRQLRQALE
ncbi:MAG: PH domain-containing protein [Verrucomicrobiota bacterium]